MKKQVRSVLIISIALCLAAFVSAEERQERIINGAPSNTPWPWMVSLAFVGSDLARGHFCGGTLIDSRFVLTGAHCVADLVSTPDAIEVVIGRENLTDTSGVVVRADGIIIFPAFNWDSLQNDLALIRLSRAVPQYQILPLLSPDDAQQLPPETLALILGWGVTDPFVPIRPAKLQQAFVPLISDAQCIDRLGVDFSPASMLCAGVLSSSPFESDGIDTCYGDSGGPLMVQTQDGWKLLGITSWGFVCASDRYWGVYTRVSAFYEWLNSALTQVLYATNSTSISGTPVVGKKLQCNLGAYHGESSQPPQVQWKDVNSGRYVSKQLVYTIKATDIGKTFRCEVSMGNAYGMLFSESQPSGPVYPGRSGARFRIKGAARLVRDAGVYCLGKKCSVLLSFRNPVKFVEGLIPNDSACKSPRACKLPSAWKTALPLSETSWRIQLQRGLNKPARLLVRATERDPERNLVFELHRS